MISHSEKEEQLLWRELAQKDSLTKIYNSAACREKAEEFLQNNTAAQVALIIIDIDNFKYINDTYGHLCGDIVLTKNSSGIIGSEPSFRYLWTGWWRCNF